jgi:hypothetical protein
MEAEKGQSYLSLRRHQRGPSMADFGFWYMQDLRPPHCSKVALAKPIR